MLSEPVHTEVPSSQRDPAASARLIAACRARLFRQTVAPVVSVVIPVFNQWPVTERCLYSLMLCDVDVAIEVIVVDDCSRDRTAEALAQLPGVNVVRNGVNLGFVHGCNRGASIARGRYLWLLNNDTELAPNAIRAIVDRLDSDETVGIVGSKLVYPDGRLQEAGGIIWSDATGWNYGRFDNPDRAEYNFVRDADYVSGASLCIRVDLFRSLGGLDKRYAPAYYEDTDICFAARAQGFRVVYEPTSVVTHYEGLTSGTDLSSGMKRFQAMNQPLFRGKWSDVLTNEHDSGSPERVRTAARRRGGHRRAILIVDSYVPLYDRESGSNRLRHLMTGFLDARYRIVFLPDNLAAMQPYTRELQQLGIEVLYHVDGEARRWKEMLNDALPTVDVAWICRPELCRKYLPEIRASSSIPVLYDTIDLHHVRLRREAELENRADDPTWRQVEALELACARAADATIVVSDIERTLLEAAGIRPVAVVSNIHDVVAGEPPSFERSSGLIFIGGYNHTPNVDAAEWLVREIMPRVWEALPEVTLTLLGANPPERVRALAGPGVNVTGYIRDVTAFFRSARVFVAPLRFGAGVKGKIGQALEFALPIVTTPVGAEGLGFAHRRDAMIAEDAGAFADAAVELYQDRDLWMRLSAAAPRMLEPFSSKRVVKAALGVVERIVAASSVAR